MINRISVPGMREHVMRLLNKYDIGYGWRSRGGYALVEFEEVCIAPIRSAVSYATALHEIGHVRGKFQRSKSVMVRERWAWRWAEQNALVWAPSMENHCRASLARYEARHRQIDAKWRPFEWPNAEQSGVRLAKPKAKRKTK